MLADLESYCVLIREGRSNPSEGMASTVTNDEYWQSECEIGEYNKLCKWTPPTTLLNTTPHQVAGGAMVVNLSGTNVGIKRSCMKSRLEVGLVNFKAYSNSKSVQDGPSKANDVARWAGTGRALHNPEEPLTEKLWLIITIISSFSPWIQRDPSETGNPSAVAARTVTDFERTEFLICSLPPTHALSPRYGNEDIIYIAEVLFRVWKSSPCSIPNLSQILMQRLTRCLGPHTAVYHHAWRCQRWTYRFS